MRRGRNNASDGSDDGELLDEELQALRAIDDPNAFVPLYHRYQPELFTFLARRAGNRVDAEDLTSKTMFNAFRQRASFRGGSYRKWIYTIAINALRDHFKQPRSPYELPPAMADKRPGTEELAQ